MDDDTKARPTLPERLEELSKTVTAGFATVSGQLTDVQGRLTKIEVFAENTDTLCKNIWDSQMSLERRMDEGFEQAKKERDEQFDVLKLAVHRWGERVEALETRRVRATKRRP